MTGNEPRRIQSIGVGFRVVRALVRMHGDAALKDIAAAAGMPAGKVHPYLASFVREGLVRQDKATGRYGLGDFAMELGLAAVRDRDVVSLAQGALERLRAETGCAAYLSIWGERGPMIVRRIDGPRQGSMTIRIGTILPLLLTATGQIFTTFMPRDVMEPVLFLPQSGAAAARPAASRAALRRRAAEIGARVRADGHAVSEGQYNAGFTAVSVPVRDHAGDLVAALTVIGPRQILGVETRASVIALAITCGKDLSARLGYSRAGEGEE